MRRVTTTAMFIELFFLTMLFFSICLTFFPSHPISREVEVEVLDVGRENEGSAVAVIFFVFLVIFS